MGRQARAARLEVTLRCWQCHRHYGPAPVLGYAGRNPATPGGWDVEVTRRVGRPTRPNLTKPGNDGGVPHGRFPYPVAGDGQRTVVIPIYPPMPAVQLICPSRRCTARPRESRAALVKLAEEALRRGERDAYV
jgi:hypothetical protein